MDLVSGAAEPLMQRDMIPDENMEHLYSGSIIITLIIIIIVIVRLTDLLRIPRRLYLDRTCNTFSLLPEVRKTPFFSFFFSVFLFLYQYCYWYEYQDKCSQARKQANVYFTTLWRLNVLHCEPWTLDNWRQINSCLPADHITAVIRVIFGHNLHHAKQTLHNLSPEQAYP